MKQQLFLIILFGAVDAREFTDEDYYRLPRLFHLDDYQQCLSRLEGLYCLGTFHYTVSGGSNYVYDLMKEYSSERHHFNRTLIHRGYCVSSRCPELNGSHVTRFQVCAERINQQIIDITMGKKFLTHSEHLDLEKLLENSTLALVQTSGQSEQMKTSLVELQYCHTGLQLQEVNIDAAKLGFSMVICAVVLLNLIGTIYDARTKKSGKNRFLIVWSMVRNWNQLTSSKNTIASSPLASLYGIKVGITISVCVSHAALLHIMTYSYNPRTLEEIVSHPLSMLIQNSTSVEQMLFVISGFLLSRQLSHQEGQPIGIRTAAYVVAKRIFRLLPVYVLVVGFAATWWPDSGSGPLWNSVNAESRVCRSKFWTHLLFVNNLIEPDKLCVLSTWYTAVDFQLHVISTIILLFLTRLRVMKLPALMVLFISSALLSAGLAYVFNWSPMMYLTTSPEKIRISFRGEPSFAGLYMSPWGNLPAGVLGLVAGQLYYGAARNFYSNVENLKWLLTPICIFSVPAMVSWMAAGYWLQHVTSKGFVVAYVAVERSIFQVCCLLSFFAVCAIRGFVIKLLSWRGWLTMSRLSYPVMLIHWLVNFYIVASTPQPLTASLMDISIYGYITAFYSFLLAVPVTILVEMPLKRFFDVITSSSNYVKVQNK